MFFLIYHFYIQSKKRYRTIERNEKQKEEISRFIQIKKKIATLLVPILILLAIYSFLNWGIGIIYPSSSVSFKDINNVFFDQFFSVLIIADVILLLFSFFLTDEFHVVIRNSGFIISTILIRLSFSVTGLLNTILIISAILFGLFVLIIHNKFEKQIALETTNDKPRL